MTHVDDLCPCVGVCMADADEAYCIGCGRPWGEPRPAPAADAPTTTPAPAAADDVSPA
jgi:hypothetical protein